MSKLNDKWLRLTGVPLVANGRSKAGVKVLEELKGEVNGKSELSYTGSPSRVEIKVDGDSKIYSKL